jgi:Carboxypeptidase regulatory-like domain
MLVFVAGLIASIPAAAQATQIPAAPPGRIIGTVTDVKGDAVAGATVVLSGPHSTNSRTLTTDDTGSFDFSNLETGVSFEVLISGGGFADWTSPTVTLDPGQVKVLAAMLQIATVNTTVTVTYDPVVIATEQMKTEEKQRVLGVIPNFYVSYEGDNAAPLTAKMKFQLAMKISYDPFTIGGVALVAGLRQATDSPNYPQGAKGYGERFGSTGADGFSDILIGGALLPAVLHEDPRYFYQGTGRTKSRILHALSSPFWCKRDDGSWGPNYASVGGDLGSAALSNLYYPESNRGAGLVFSSFAVGTAERMGAALAQEFIVAKLAHRGGHVQDASQQ